MVICLERRADLHMAQLMPLPLTVSCFSKIQIGFIFLVPAYPGSPGKGPLNGCVLISLRKCPHDHQPTDKAYLSDSTSLSPYVFSMLKRTESPHSRLHQ